MVENAKLRSQFRAKTSKLGDKILFAERVTYMHASELF